MQSLRFGLAAALSLASISTPALASAPIFTVGHDDVKAVLASARPSREDRKRRDRRRAHGTTYRRGDKLGRRLRRKFELGRAGAF